MSTNKATPKEIAAAQRQLEQKLQAHNPQWESPPLPKKSPPQHQPHANYWFIALILFVIGLLALGIAFFKQQLSGTELISLGIFLLLSGWAVAYDKISQRILSHTHSRWLSYSQRKNQAITAKQHAALKKALQKTQKKEE